MAAHTHSIPGRHKVATVLARHGVARPKAFLCSVRSVHLLGIHLLPVGHVTVVPRRNADRVDETIGQGRAVQEPHGTASRADKYIVNK
eukprot:15480072-Heterocapsa_arctica.AAC.1